MLKINSNRLTEEPWKSPQGKFAGASKSVSEALGRKPQSTDLNERHPFDVEILRIPAGKIPYPYHSHSAQWEFYHVISGQGSVRHHDGTTPIEAGDAFVFKPGEPHQLINDSTRTWFSTWWRTIPWVSRFIITTARNGRCARPNAGYFAVNRWRITTVKSDRFSKDAPNKKEPNKTP